MKFAVLMLALVSAVHCGIDAFVTVKGTLTCKEPFRYKMELREKEPKIMEIETMARLSQRKSVGNKGDYFISGKGSEFWPRDNEIEPRLYIKHSCGGIDRCVCKDFGDVSSDLETSLNVDLTKPDWTTLKECKEC